MEEAVRVVKDWVIFNGKGDYRYTPDMGVVFSYLTAVYLQFCSVLPTENLCERNLSN